MTMPIPFVASGRVKPCPRKPIAILYCVLAVALSTATPLLALAGDELPALGIPAVEGASGMATNAPLGPSIAGTINPDAPVTGRINNTWTLTVMESRCYAIDLRSDDFDALLRLLDHAGQVLQQDDDSGPGHHARLLTRLIPGTYGLEVVAAGEAQGGAYEIQANTETCNTLAPGEEAMTAYLPEGGAQWVLPDLPAGDILLIEITSTDFTPSIELRGADLEVLGADGGDRGGRTTLLARLAEGEAHLLMVTGQKEQDHGTYGVRIDLVPHQILDLATLERGIEARLETDMAYQEWRFHAEAGQRFLLRLSSPHVATTVGLIAPSGATVLLGDTRYRDVHALRGLVQIEEAGEHHLLIGRTHPEQGAGVFHLRLEPLTTPKRGVDIRVQRDQAEPALAALRGCGLTAVQRVNLGAEAPAGGSAGRSVA